MKLKLTGRKCKKLTDCVSACINTLMDRDDCPHFFNGENDADTAWRLLREWMRGHGKDLFLAPYRDDPRELMQEANPAAHYMLIYDTHDDTHAAIFKDAERVFDPAWNSKPIKGGIDGKYWLVGVVVDYYS